MLGWRWSQSRTVFSLIRTLTLPLVLPSVRYPLPLAWAHLERWC